MCGPAALPIVAMAVQLGTQAISGHQQEIAQKRLFNANRKVANASAINQYQAILDRQRQEAAAAAQGIQKAASGARKTIASARVAAGEAGVAGLSVDALVGDFERTESEYQRSVIRNKAFVDTQLTSQLEAVRLGQQGQILSALPGGVPQPNYLQGVVNAYGKYLAVDYAEKSGGNPYSAGVT